MEGSLWVGDLITYPFYPNICSAIFSGQAGIGTCDFLEKNRFLKKIEPAAVIVFPKYSLASRRFNSRAAFANFLQEYDFFQKSAEPLKVAERNGDERDRY